MLIRRPRVVRDWIYPIYIGAYCPVHTFEVKGGGRGGHFPKGIPGLTDKPNQIETVIEGMCD